MTPALQALSEPELIDWLRLIRSDTIGPRTFRGLLARFGSAGAALDALPRLGNRTIKIATLRDVEAELDSARRSGIRFVALGEPPYPASLRAIDSAPPLLAVKGRVEVLAKSMVAIVGSRNASAAGLVMTERVGGGLGAAGHVVVSGLARGIDAKAHLASLATGTVAVLAGGHDRIYPSEHAGLAARIAETGAVVSEMPLAWEPRGRDFPRRNRIVSGLSLAVVVVEAARRSGSLITARFANEQGREVFAVPGSPLDPRAEGTNDLLRQGATFCTGIDDVLDVLAPMAQVPVPMSAMREAARRASTAPLYWDEGDLDGDLPGPRAVAVQPAGHQVDDDPAPTDARACLITLVGATPVSIDELVRVAGLSAQEVQSLVVELEIEGVLLRHGTHLVSRVIDGARGPADDTAAPTLE